LKEPVKNNLTFLITCPVAFRRCDERFEVIVAADFQGYKRNKPVFRQG
jgi:hypothetical protein